MRTFKILIITAILLTSTLVSRAQVNDYVNFTDSTFLKIKTVDGSEIYGFFHGTDQEYIIIKTDNFGEIHVAMKNIREIEEIKPDRMREGGYWFENPNATRYLFSPSAIPLRRGEGYYQNSYLMINMFNVGATDHFSMGGGFELISTFTGHPTVFITPKISGKVGENTYLGIGTIAGFTTLTGEGSNDISGFGITYGVATYGNRDNNLTTGIGFGFADGSFQQKPFITISGMKRISRKVGFVSENWLIPVVGYEYVITYALRFMSEKITVDFGFINNQDIARGIFIGIPYIDFVVKFEK